MKIKEIILSCLLTMFVVLAPCACSTNPTTSASYIAGESLMDSSLVRWIGRTEYLAQEERVYTYYSATGFTVNFQGTELYVTYNATNTDSDKNRPYFVCMVDEQTAEEGTSFCLNNPTQTLKVVSGLENKNHKVTILKRSEPENSLTSISEIFTDGKFLQPDEHNGLRFQIIGSSGITGHGCLGNITEDWTTANSSSLKGFGYLAAQKFGAECQFVSASGMGMVWSYRGVATMIEAYEATGLIASYNNDGTTKNVTAHGEWDHSAWVPDVIIANIGGNDWNKKINTLGEGTNARTEAENQFKNAVISLLTRINTLYPEVKVIWTCNSTTSGNGALASDAIQTLSFKNRIHLVPIDSTKDGADNHASFATQAANATTVANAITSYCGLVQI